MLFFLSCRGGNEAERGLKPRQANSKSVPFAAMWPTELPIKMLLKLLFTGKEEREGEAGEHPHALLDSKSGIGLRNELAAS